MEKDKQSLFWVIFSEMVWSAVKGYWNYINCLYNGKFECVIVSNFIVSTLYTAGEINFLSLSFIYTFSERKPQKVEAWK